jgi:hypothetical protein
MLNSKLPGTYNTGHHYRAGSSLNGRFSGCAAGQRRDEQLQ